MRVCRRSSSWPHLQTSTTVVFAPIGVIYWSRFVYFSFHVRDVWSHLPLKSVLHGEEKRREHTDFPNGGHVLAKLVLTTCQTPITMGGMTLCERKDQAYTLCEGTMAWRASRVPANSTALIAF